MCSPRVVHPDSPCTSVAIITPRDGHRRSGKKIAARRTPEQKWSPASRSPFTDAHTSERRTRTNLRWVTLACCFWVVEDKNKTVYRKRVDGHQGWNPADPRCSGVPRLLLVREVADPHERMRISQPQGATGGVKDHAPQAQPGGRELRRYYARGLEMYWCA